MAMLDVLARLAGELGIALEVASVDHGLRAEAAREVALVGAATARLGLPFHPLRVELGTRGSLQARARAARYEALLALAGDRGARRIAVGHTRDDQAETVLARLLRGAGPRGLAGIAPRRADGVIRPLIDATRADARSWLDAHHIEFIEDPSNDERRFQRVRLRRELLPALRAESPALDAHLARLADEQRALAAMVRSRARRVLARAARAGAPDALAGGARALDAATLLRAPPPVRAEALRAWAESLAAGRTIRRAHLDALDAALQGRGYARLPGGRAARLDDHGVLRAEPAPPLSVESAAGSRGHGARSDDERSDDEEA